MLNYLEGRLAEIKVNSKPYYAKIYREANIKSVDFDVAMIQVDVGQTSLSQRTGTEVRTQCPKGKIACNDKDAAHYSVNCVTRTAATPISINVRDGASGTLIWSDRQAATAESKVCSDTGGSLKESAELQGENIAWAGSRLLAKFTPKKDKRALELIEEDASLKDKVAERVKMAYDFAAKQDMDSACKTYDDIAQSTPNSGIILFNMGYCKQAEGYFGQAKELYEKESNADAPPKDLITKYLAETNT